MNKSIGIVILAALLLAANASFIEHIYNNTHLRGNVKLDTSDGVKVGYNGGLYFDNGFLGFDIANIGGNLKAAVRPGSKFGNETNSSIDYSGDIQVSHGEHSADISVNGTAGIYAEFGKEETAKGDSFGYKATVTNENNWTVNAGNRTAEGTSEGCLHGKAHIEKDGNEIFVEKKLKGGVIHKGTLTDGVNEDTFEVAKFGKLKLEKEIWIKNTSEVGDHFGGVFPTLGYAGEAKVKRKEHIVWNDDTVDTKGKGKGRFSGLIWYDKDDQNNTYIRSVKHAKSAEFVHGGKVAINDKLHAIYGGAGIVGEISSAVMKLDNATKNFSGGFFDSGNMHYIGVDIAKPKSEDELLVEKMQNGPGYVMGDVDDHDKKHKVKVVTKTSWAAGKGVKVNNNDDGTVDVKSHGGAVWEVDGWASNSKKPIHERGEKTYNSSFTFDKNTDTIKNILVKFGKDPKAIEELRQRFRTMKAVA